MKNLKLLARDLLLILLVSDAVVFILFLRNENFNYAIICGVLLGFLAGAITATEVFIKPKLYSILKKLKSFRGKKDPDNSEKKKNIFEKIDGEISGWAEDGREESEKRSKLENYRKEFLGNVSHELKTPIFNIQGYLHTLIDGGLEDATINRKFLERSAKSVERLITIVEDLETISQLEAGELELSPEKFDLAALTRDIFDSSEMKASQKKISLVLKNNPNEVVTVFADRKRIRQVLSNLISNSIRYGKENGETKVKLSGAGEKILVEVADNGIGISDIHLPRIFERFYRADKSRSREQGGTGLGLSIVKHIIEAHKQTIQVMSTEGAGSVFSFSLMKG